jgi:hypothetical protein
VRSAASSLLFLPSALPFQQTPFLATLPLCQSLEVLGLAFGVRLFCALGLLDCCPFLCGHCGQFCLLLFRRCGRRLLLFFLHISKKLLFAMPFRGVSFDSILSGCVKNSF